MPKKALDPAGHMSLAVSNFRKSRSFYADLFGLLKFKKIRDSKDSVGWATKEGFGIWIKPAQHRQLNYTYFSPGIQHLCVKAESRALVHKISTLLSENWGIIAKPKRYPRYTARYYAVFFLDPDGIKIEVAYY